MRKGLAAWGVWLILLSTPVAGAPYLQPGADAARTGVTGDEGPARDEVAWRVLLPGARAPGDSPPLILDGNVYLPIVEASRAPLNTTAIVRVEIHSATVTVVQRLPRPPNGFASDGERLFLVDVEGVHALGLDGEALWSWYPEPVLPERDGGLACLPPALRAGALFVGCVAWSSPGGDLVNAGYRLRLVTARLDAGAGEPVWVTSVEIESEPSPEGILNIASGATFPTISGLAVVEDSVVVLTQAVGATGASARVWTFEAASGAPVWAHDVTLSSDPSQADVDPRLQRSVVFLGDPTGGGGEFYVALDRLLAFTPTSPTPAWSRGLARSNPAAVGGTALALSGTNLWVAAHDTLRSIDVASRSERWTHVLSGTEHFDDQPLLLAGATLFARSHASTAVSGSPVILDQAAGQEGDEGNIIYAFDAPTGRFLWRHAFQQDPERSTGSEVAQFTMGVGEGTMAVAGRDGSLALLGRTPASLMPHLHASTLFPSPREVVAVDLSGTRPGIQGPPTEYRAIWGDGTESPWQTDAVLTHAYASPRDFDATFLVRNEAGQLSQETVLFSVGGSPPTILQEVFARENQDLTFGVLGIVVALGGGLVAVTRGRTRRSRLQNELVAIEEAYQRTLQRPRDCEAALAERRANAHGLLLDGKLEEGQVAVLERRIDELSRELRMGALERELHFLPYGLVMSLREMLTDGQISLWEQEHIQRAVEGDETMSPAQKERILQVVAAWAEKDRTG